MVGLPGIVSASAALIDVGGPTAAGVGWATAIAYPFALVGFIFYLLAVRRVPSPPPPSPCPPPPPLQPQMPPRGPRRKPED